MNGNRKLSFYKRKYSYSLFINRHLLYGTFLFLKQIQWLYAGMPSIDIFLADIHSGDYLKWYNWVLFKPKIVKLIYFASHRSIADHCVSNSWLFTKLLISSDIYRDTRMSSFYYRKLIAKYRKGLKIYVSYINTNFKIHT